MGRKAAALVEITMSFTLLNYRLGRVVVSTDGVRGCGSTRTNQEDALYGLKKSSEMPKHPPGNAKFFLIRQFHTVKGVLLESSQKCRIFFTGIAGGKIRRSSETVQRGIISTSISILTVQCSCTDLPGMSLKMSLT
jgi:hypothetical protein